MGMEITFDRMFPSRLRNLEDQTIEIINDMPITYDIEKGRFAECNAVQLSQLIIISNTLNPVGLSNWLPGRDDIIVKNAN